MGEPSPEATTTARTATSADSTSAESGTDSEQLTGAAAMFANDRASQHLGITVDDHGPGWAQCSMTITDIMANGHEITHGGYIFLFADTTFAMACNYPGSITVASGGDIDFLKPTYVGDKLIARGKEIVKQGRSGIYDIEVTRGDEIVATYRGRSRTLPPPKPATPST
ncbi:MAG: hydroxyphenylacetyl-CoA thioesterase PaaI [Brevibacterium aurantiacum]|uniref:Acyl-CoA thioesterase n=1 Tax=Brevibacterium aurantiacum TaxID=273384 RepID=A0A1D7VYR2_BREAU|nr:MULTISPECIES: hydroxyphenylacetyl-CoA thioesterase PaaI [Brevibacterium]AOP51867.1 Phenylacetic acid degradation protein PaaD, thioesterase [Brevibacterium aurantiacum]AZL07917.1 phenylacetic acid degradation protein PaaD [Brevibacterium aurantiacum]AZL11525.1 phenylacetic acid degradation protein PaaD [Brevibacterium aurantiacum]PCC48234.1 phenylacetic acid degradation protein PaaD [Brevibacterium aurantiacum]PCC55040.1 phenylacetic acid degradation protein PaaD [Brevibacterium aurantiacum